MVQGKKSYWEKCKNVVYIRLLSSVFVLLGVGMLTAGLVLTINKEEECKTSPDPNCLNENRELSLGLTIAGGVVLGLSLMINWITYVAMAAKKCWKFMLFFVFLWPF